MPLKNSEVNVMRYSCCLFYGYLHGFVVAVKTETEKHRLHELLIAKLSLKLGSFSCCTYYKNLVVGLYVFYALNIYVKFYVNYIYYYSIHKFNFYT